MSRSSRQVNQFGGRVEPIVFKSMSSSKNRGSKEPKHGLQMTSRSTVLSNAVIELSQTRNTLECIREDDKGHASQQPTTTTDLFTVPTNQQKSRNPSPASSDCRWGLVDDDESQSRHEDRQMYKKICVMIGVVCFISIGALLLTALMLVGFIGSNTGCACSTSSQVTPQSELQKQVKEMGQMERNMSEISNTMRHQNEELQRLWVLLKITREELQKLKPATEIPVSTTTEKTKPTTSSSLNTTNMTSGITPSNTPFVDPIEISLTQLWVAHNDSVQEIAKLGFKVRNISLIPGPTGPIGRDGPIGPSGPPGPNGRTGENGTRGPVGPRGPMGLRGYNGTRGPTGAQGAPGQQGQKGNQGPEGPQGPVGRRGYNGSRGPPGRRGVTGPKGNQGNTGRRGLQGTQGSQGPAGPPGPRGAGNFSQCVYKRADTSGTPRSSSAYDSLFVTEPAGSRIIGTVCSTNNAQETMLESVLRPNGRRYVCSCRGMSNHFNRLDRDMYCYMHYWECPLTT